MFTKDSESKHLLLNNDLIAICVSCLESSVEIKTEAQAKVAILASMLFQFQRIQKYMLNYNNGSPINGIIDLIKNICEDDYKYEN